MSEDRTRMMRDAGPPWNQNLLMVGPRGPVVFEDMLLFEKMAHSTVSASPSASCTPRGRAPTATSLHQCRPAGLYDREAVLRGRKADADVPALTAATKRFGPTCARSLP